MRGDARLALNVSFSGRVQTATPVISRMTDNAMVQTWRLSAIEPLAGQEVRIDGLASTMTDALVRIEFVDGGEWVGRLTPGSAAGDDPGPSRRLGGRCHLSEARRRAHPARHRSSALRARSHPDRTEHAAAHPGDHGFHRRAQHHTRRGDSWLCQCAAATGRGGDRAVDRLRRRRDHPRARGQGWYRRPRALGRRVRVRAPPRLRLRRGA